MKVHEKLEQSLKLLGVSQEVNTFAERKRLQKLVYLLEKSGIHLGFRFSWYVYGPYSPSLTKVLYKEDPRLNEQITGGRDDKKKIMALKEALGQDIRSADTLELIASLHYLITLGSEQQKSDEEIYKLFRELKPFFSEENTRYYFKMVNSLIDKGILSKN